MQSVSTFLPRLAKAEDLACRRGSRMIAPPARLHHGPNTAAMGVRARQFRTVASIYRETAPSRLLRRANTNCNQRRIRSAWNRAAGSASFAEELCLIARRAAVSGDHDFIVLALHRAPRNAVQSDHPDAWAGRIWRPFFTLRAGRTRRPRRTDRTRIALGALRPGWTCIALRALTAGSQADEQHQCQRQGQRHVRHAHGHILPREGRPDAAA